MIPRMRALDGVRVLELGGLVSAAYAAKLLADLGADVIKIEPEGGDPARARGPFPPGYEGDPERSGLFLYLNAGKRSRITELAGPDFEGLLGEADIVLHNFTAPELAERGLDPEAWLATHPGLVVGSVTPFGLSGPHSHYRAAELNAVHAGGWGYLSPGALEDPALPPLKPFGHQADFQGALALAAAVTAAFRRAQRTGIGEHVDLSTQAYVASILEAALVTYTYAGEVPTRLGARGLNPWSIFACQDGLIFLCTIEEDQWQRLVELMGNPDWAGLEVFADFESRLANADILHEFIGQWCAEWKVRELFHAGQAKRITFAPVLTMREMAAEPHLAARGFFVEVEHPAAGTVKQPGAPFLLSRPWWRIRGGAPTLNAHPDAVFGERREIEPPPLGNAELPLSGVRVADFSWVWAGPFCAMQLAHLGAEVIKVESPERSDLGRRLPIHVPDSEPDLDCSGYFNQWNQGKRSLALNLGHPEALEVAKRLITSADVVVENFATGVMERLGLGYEVLRELKPDLIYASISGYGETGPYRHYMGYGPAIGPLSGLSSLTGYPGGGPRELGISLGDPTAGITAAFGIIAALVARDRTGEGQKLDTSLWESTAALQAEGFMAVALGGEQPERMGNRDPWWAPHGVFPCAGEDRWISLACRDDSEWEALAAEIGEPARALRFSRQSGRKAHEDELEAIIAAWTKQQDAWALTRRLQAAGVPAYPSLSMAHLVEDPGLRSRGFFAELPHPKVGVRTHAGIPWLLRNGPNGVRRPAPLLGADSEDVLHELGYGDAEIARLRRSGALG